MVNVFISYEVILSGGPMPEGLREVISQDLWSNLRAAVNDANNDANSNACLGEILVCVCCAFPCIFLCHFCFFTALKESDMREKLRVFNNVYFGGSLVLTVQSEKGIMLNTDLISPFTINRTLSPIIHVQSATVPVSLYANAQYMDDFNAPSEAVAVPYNSDNQYIHSDDNKPIETVAYLAPESVSISPKRTIKVIVPDDVQPGQQLQVRTTDNLTVMITIPEGVVPGQQIVVEY
mmetsp:Transcript_23226/g.21111  ORF Transcript_23226/g.21111 Transcript_23226/m.21111 type:complete len:235 (+) Transcript_23226:50-754(+)